MHQHRISKFTTLLLTLLLCSQGGQLFGQKLSGGGGASSGNNPAEINLKSRTFVPDVQTSMPQASYGGSQHVVVMQFDQELDGNTLAQLNLPCMGKVSEYAAITMVPAGYSMQNIPHLRWAGKLQASDRMSNSAREELDDDPSGTHIMQVRRYPNTPKGAFPIQNVTNRPDLGSSPGFRRGNRNVFWSSSSI